MTPSLRPTAKILLAFLILAFGGVSAWILRNNESTEISATQLNTTDYGDDAISASRYSAGQSELSTQNSKDVADTKSVANTQRLASTQNAVPTAFWEPYEKQPVDSLAIPDTAPPQDAFGLPLVPSQPQAHYAQAYRPPTLDSANLVPSVDSLRTSDEKEDITGLVHEVRKPDAPENASSRLDILPSAAIREEESEPLPTGADFRIVEDNPLAESLTTTALPPLPEAAPPSPPETAEVLGNPRYLLKPLPEVLDENRVAQTELADPVPGLMQMVPLEQIPVTPSPFDRPPTGGHDCVMVPIKSLPPVDEALSPFNPKRQADNPRSP